jgi:hypothetical protein
MLLPAIRVRFRDFWKWHDALYLVFLDTFGSFYRCFETPV